MPRPDYAATRDLLGRAGAIRVLVIGDVMLDRYVEGTVRRISPEAPVPVVHVTRERVALGGAANVAAGVAALGAGCALVGAAGDDEPGSRLREALDAAGIGSGAIVATPGRPTIQKTRILGGGQQMLRVDREERGLLSDEAGRELIERAGAELERADVVVFQDYDKGTIAPALARRLIEAAAARDVPTVVDPKLRHFHEFRGATVFKPNRQELAAGLGIEEAAIDGLDLPSVLERLGVHNLLLTLGREGMLLVGRDVEGVERVPSQAREVFDVTGAGDTVLAVTSVALAAGASLVEAARLATVAAGLVVSRAGAVSITSDELLEALAPRD
jgi:D-beta-D-heptose 7-phosphate kinase/D-beta-D-heptose 1-phosphate adenosyltransferase